MKRIAVFSIPIMLFAVLVVSGCTQTFDSYCAGLKDPAIKADCYKNMAEANEDITYCMPRFTNDTAGCMNFVLNETGFYSCTKVDDEWKDLCYGSAAVIFRNELACEKVNNTAIRDPCMKDVAVLRKNSTICYSITDGMLEDDCYYSVARVTNDSVLCGRISRPNADLANECLRGTGAIV